jgi:hypothetical protein
MNVSHPHSRSDGSSFGCASPKGIRTRLLTFPRDARQDRRVLEAIFVLIRAFALACRGHRAIILENIAIRHQLRMLQSTVKRPHLSPRDRLFWILLAETWRD